MSKKYDIRKDDEVIDILGDHYSTLDDHVKNKMSFLEYLSLVHSLVFLAKEEMN